jgi:CheY-like chemotaxis protein
MAEPETTSAINVLLAEDCEMTRMLGCAYLKKLGCEVTVACDGREALHKATERPFDVIFMDCEMPEMDGIDATREIRRHEQTSGARRVAIVALTASGHANDRATCAAAGMDDLVEKPYKREDLRLALLRHVTKPQEESAKVG